jgi:hypothetical protein
LQVKVSCAKQFPDEVDEPFISDLFAEKVYQDSMFDFVEAGPDISLQEPVEGRPLSAYFAESCMATAVWTKTVTSVMEVGTIGTLIDTFEDESNDLLHDFITCGRYS